MGDYCGLEPSGQVGRVGLGSAGYPLRSELFYDSSVIRRRESKQINKTIQIGCLPQPYPYPYPLFGVPSFGYTIYQLGVEPIRVESSFSCL